MAAIPPRNAPGKLEVTHLFERFGLDYVGPLPTSTSGKNYIIVGMEYYTKWPVARAVVKADAANAVDFVYEEIMCQFGPPKILLTDGGKHFDNRFVDMLCEKVNTAHHFASPYHPETNGLVERFNGTLVKALKKLTIAEPAKWDTFIPSVLYAYRTRIHSTLKISPFELLYGIDNSSPRPDLIKEIGVRLGFERLYYLQDRHLRDIDNATMERQIDNLAQPSNFAPGMFVLRVNRHRSDKLTPTYLPSPLLITGVFQNRTVSACTLAGKPLKRRLNVQEVRPLLLRPLGGVIYPTNRTQD